jgi:hypothetical protein
MGSQFALERMEMVISAHNSLSSQDPWDQYFNVSNISFAFQIGGGPMITWKY